MVSPPHEIPIEILRDEPTLLPELLRALGIADLGGGLHVVDATLRRADPAEVHPDLVLDIGEGGGWALVELQLSLDIAKQRRWALMVALQFDQRKIMGDLVVLTPHRRVAEWAHGLVAVRGPLGTELVVRPLVVHISDHNVDQLLSAERPELAFFAAWAMHHRRGRRARKIVKTALEVTGRLPAPDRGPATRAILNMLNPHMLSHIREVMMLDPSRFPESDAMRALREELEAIGEARGEARGETRGIAKALLAFMTQRNIPISDAIRDRVTGCDDAAQLEEWVGRTAHATSAEEIFGSD